MLRWARGSKGLRPSCRWVSRGRARSPLVGVQGAKALVRVHGDIRLGDGGRGRAQSPRSGGPGGQERPPVEGQGADEIAHCRVSRGRRASGRVHGAKLLAGGCNGGGCAPCQDEPKALRGLTAHILQSAVPAVCGVCGGLWKVFRLLARIALRSILRKCCSRDVRGRLTTVSCNVRKLNTSLHMKGERLAQSGLTKS